MLLSRVVKFFCSLRLTVVCLALALVLVFAGTLAQVNIGLYAAQAKYFRSLFVLWPVPGTGLKLPVYPGGYLIGGVLVINLVAAYFSRFGLRKEKAGLLMVHSGLVLLLLGQLATDLLQVESGMRLTEGETKNFSEDFRANELVVVDTTDPAHNNVVAIPDRLVAKDRELSLPQLPFAVRVKQYWPNADLLMQPTNGAVAVVATRGVGRGLYLIPRPVATSSEERNSPAAVVELEGDQGPVGSWLVSSALGAKQDFSYGQKSYQIALRVSRHYYPYSLTLLKARHDVYMGTEIPRNFSSRVRLQRPETGEDREVLIRMNAPLRYGGETYYQYQMADAGNGKVSTLQVVHNPGWLTPYLACSLVGTGLVVQFMTHLIGFVRRRKA